MKAFCLACALACLPLAAAYADGFVTGINVGTSGLGGELQYGFGDSGFVARADGDYLDVSRDETYQSIRYSGRLKFATAGAFLDYHPWQSWFLVSAGAYIGRREVTLNSNSVSTLSLNSIVYTATQAGNLSGAVKYHTVQPFVGLGFDNSFLDEPGFGFKAIVGVAYDGSPSVTLNSTGGTLSNTPIFQANLEAEREKIAHDARGFEYYPIVQVGLTYRF